MGPETRDVAVIGGGIIGICCGLYLQEKGFAVRLFDRAGPDEQRTSWGNAGNISPWSCVPESLPGLWRSVPGWLLDPLGPMAVRWPHLPAVSPWLLRFLAAGRATRIPALADALRSLYAPTIELYEDLLRGTGDEDLIRRCLYVHLYRRAEDARLDTLGWRLRLERGARAEVIGAAELRQIEPDISGDYQRAIILHGQGRTANPARLLVRLTQRFLAQGGQIVRAEVKQLQPQQAFVRFVTTQGEQQASQVVLAAGAWSTSLLRPLGLRIPLETERGYHLTLQDPGVAINNTIMEAGRLVVASSMESGLRLAGTVELGGLTKPADPRRARGLGVLGKTMFPGLRTDRASTWMGHRPSLPDSLPIIGPAPGAPRILLAFGHSHLGLSGGPPTGRLIAQMAAGEPTAIDMQPYRADRFA